MIAKNIKHLCDVFTLLTDDILLYYIYFLDCTNGFFEANIFLIGIYLLKKSKKMNASNSKIGRPAVLGL